MGTVIKVLGARRKSDMCPCQGLGAHPTLTIKPEGQTGDWLRAMLRGKESSQLPWTWSCKKAYDTDRIQAPEG